MSKITISETINPDFPPEVGDYLAAHGYRRMNCRNGLIQFYKGDKAIMVWQDSIDFLQQDNAGTYKRYRSVSGIGDLSEFDWTMVLHVGGAVTLKELVRKVKKEMPEEVPGFMVTIYDHFRITDDHNAVPVNY
jgi:hypothetical protein